MSRCVTFFPEERFSLAADVRTQPDTSVRWQFHTSPPTAADPVLLLPTQLEQVGRGPHGSSVKCARDRVATARKTGGESRADKHWAKSRHRMFTSKIQGGPDENQETVLVHTVDLQNIDKRPNSKETAASLKDARGERGNRRDAPWIRRATGWRWTFLRWSH